MGTIFLDIVRYIRWAQYFWLHKVGTIFFRFFNSDFLRIHIIHKISDYVRVHKVGTIILGYFWINTLGKIF